MSRSSREPSCPGRPASRPVLIRTEDRLRWVLAPGRALKVAIGPIALAALAIAALALASTRPRTGAGRAARYTEQPGQAMFLLLALAVAVTGLVIIVAAIRRVSVLQVDRHHLVVFAHFRVRKIPWRDVGSFGGISTFNGIEVLDIRAWGHGDLMVPSSFFDDPLDEVMRTVEEFLRANPPEGISYTVEDP